MALGGISVMPEALESESGRKNSAHESAFVVEPGAESKELVGNTGHDRNESDPGENA